MSKILIVLIVVLSVSMPVQATAFTAPTVDDSGTALMPGETESFSQGLLSILREALPLIQPAFSEATRYCAGFICIALLIAIIQSVRGCPIHVLRLTSTLAVAATMLKTSHSFIGLGAETVTRISECGKLLLPVMSAALAAQGASGTSAALYTATAVFDAVLSAIISSVIIPLIYAYLCICSAYSAVGEGILEKIRDFIKWLSVWILKIILYVFTGYISITGVISGSADAAALKVTKLTISGAVPVVGGILSDASEAVLVGAATAKNAAGVYGLLALLSMCLGPFLEIGVHYLLLKLTGAVCGVLDCKSMAELIKDFSTAMGLLLGMTGAVCLMLMISTVCFMKGFS